MAKITYEDKVKLQDEPDIPNKNKVTDNDMNEIKDVVNTNADELDTAKENIENLEEGQGTNSTDITNLKGRMTTLETDNAKNKSDISNLQKDNETNKTNISNLRNSKVDKIEGKGLSTEDFTTQLKTKLEGLENYNDTEIQEKIQTIEGKVQTLEDDNASNKTNISTLQSKVTNLEKDNTDNKSNITNLQKDVDNLGKNIEENTTNIETLQAENKNLKEEVENYKNSLPRETQTGEYITMQNTADKVRFKDFVLGGNSKQESRSGKNILDINSPELYLTRTTIEKEGNVLHAETSGDSTAYISIPLKFKANTDYTLSGILKVVENTVSYASFYIKVRANKDGGDWISSNSFSVDASSTENKNIDWTFNSGEYTSGWLWIYLKQSADAGNISIDFTNLQIEEGTEATDYEQYGATPSPEIPSKIENVEGDVEVTVANKNIFDLKKGFDRTTNGVNRGTLNDDGTITTTSNFSSSRNIGIDVKLKKNTDYVISAEIVSITATSEGKQCILEICGYDKDGKFKSVVESKTFTEIGNRISMPFNSEDFDKWAVHVSGWYGSGESGTLVYKNVMVSEMDINYTQNKQQQVVFPLAQNQKLMLGDYLDDDGIHHVKKQVVLDGTENVLTPTNLGNVTRFLIYMKIEAGSYVNEEGQLSSHFKYLRNFTQDSEHFYIENDVGSIYLFTNSRTANDVNSLKAFLSTQKQAGTPVVVEYKLAEEETEEYTEEQQEAYNKLKELTTYAGQTNIYSTNSPSPIFTVTGIKDVNSLITQVNQLILEGGN